MLTLIVPLLVSPLAASPINIVKSAEDAVNRLYQARRALSSDIYRIEFTSPTATDAEIKALILGSFAGGQVVVSMDNMVVTDSGSDKVAEVTAPDGQTAQTLYNTFSSAMTTTLKTPSGASSITICAVAPGTACSSGGGSGGDSGGGSDEPCFPATALITREDGSFAPVDALKVGDRIVSATASGAMTVDRVSRFSITHPDITSSFVNLKTKDANLQVTDTHHIPVGPVCCSNLKLAKEIRVGENIFVTRNGEVTGQEVKQIGTSHAKGKYSPVMQHGTYPIVDGVVTSFDSLFGVRMASLGLSTVEAICTVTDTCAAVEKIFKLFSGATDTKYLVPSSSFANSLLLVVVTGVVAVGAQTQRKVNAP